MTRGQRFVFANQLRGIAALCVVAVHLVGVYWSQPELVAGATFSAANAGTPPAFYWLFVTPWFNLGPFGLALFFLISGFVIPLSLERQRAPAFLIGRFFRIFPTYWVALLIELAVIAAGAAYWQVPFTHTARLIAANALLVTDFANVPSIDFVNWTLIVELKFYLLVALLIGAVRRGSTIALLAVAVGILAVSRFSHEIFTVLPGLGSALRIFESNALYVIFMLAGVVFSYHVRGLISGVRLWLTVGVLFALFVACWPLTFFRADFPLATVNYGYALVVFSVAYVFRGAARPSRVLDYFAAISYPLYLVHFLVGISVMQVLIAWQVDPLLATLLAFGCAIALATTLHYAIELPSQRFGKALARGTTRPAVERVEPAAS